MKEQETTIMEEQEATIAALNRLDPKVRYFVCPDCKDYINKEYYVSGDG